MTKEIIVAALTAVGVFGAALFFAVCGVVAFVRAVDEDDEEDEDDGLKGRSDQRHGKGAAQEREDVGDAA